jgi:uncharacterized Zn finger protein (UPF0148 family)
MKYLKRFNENTVKQCPKCDAKVGSFKFCMDCGFDLYGSLTGGVVAKLCSKCKTKLKDNAMFCAECGQKVEGTSSKDNAAPKNTQNASNSNKSFEELCNDYSKMKGADINKLNVIKKMTENEKDESIKIAMIRNLIENI